LAAELGNENKTTMTTALILLQKVHIKTGFDYNAYENWLDMENIISIECDMVSVLLTNN
jgi:hypothetical protein